MPSEGVMFEAGIKDSVQFLLLQRVQKTRSASGSSKKKHFILKREQLQVHFDPHTHVISVGCVQSTLTQMGTHVSREIYPLLMPLNVGVPNYPSIHFFITRTCRLWIWVGIEPMTFSL